MFSKYKGLVYIEVYATCVRKLYTTIVTFKILPTLRLNHDIIVHKAIGWTTHQTYLEEANLNPQGGLRQGTLQNLS